jgi:hypothetical protein
MARCQSITIALVAFFIGILVGAPVGAAETHLRYEVMWGGLHAAEFALSLDGDKTTYANRFRLETRGIADWLLRLRVSVSGHGEAPAAAPLKPRAYRVGYSNRRRQRVVSLRFDEESGEVSPVVESDSRLDGDASPEAGDDNDEATISRDLRLGVIDPLSAFVESLRRVRRHLDGEPADFRLAVFDGRRRFDLEGAYAGKVRRTILNVPRELHRVRVKTIPMAGFRRAQRILWDGTTFDVFLGTDGRLLPVQIMSVGPGPVMNLVEECPALCVLPPD